MGRLQARGKRGHCILSGTHWDSAELGRQGLATRQQSEPVAKTLRDTQKSRLYRAEDTALAKDPLEVEEAKKLLEDWSEHFGLPHAPTLRIKRAGSKHSVANGDGIALGAEAVNRLTLTHEFAHHLAAHRRRILNKDLDARMNGYITEPGHGWHFAECLIEAVAYTYGPEEATALKAAFERERVAYARPPEPNGHITKRKNARRRQPAEGSMRNGYVIALHYEGQTVYVSSQRHQGRRVVVTSGRRYRQAAVWLTEKGAEAAAEAIAEHHPDHSPQVVPVRLRWQDGRWVPVRRR